MSQLIDLTLAEARDGLRSKKFSAIELTDAYLAAIDKTQNLNAYVTVTADRARQDAAKADQTLAAGDAPNMTGIPVSVKDLYCTQNIRTTACSHILENFVPSYESQATQNLWSQGAVLLGKVNNDEFAMGSSNSTSAFGKAINPWQRKDDTTELTPGGSSGGSAASVAARSALVSLGTDTGGSIRQPAAFTGTVGLKPTYGRVSRWGIIAYASSLDQAGPIARTVRDAAITLEAMAGFDDKDSTSVDTAVPNYEAALSGDVKGLKVGIPKEYDMEGLCPETRALWQQGAAWLKDQGAELVDISLPHAKYALAAYYIIAPAEASSNLARYDGVRFGTRVDGKSLDEMYENTRGEGFGKEVKRRILTGTYALSAGYYDAYYLKAQQVRRLVTEDFTKAFETVDVILTPPTPTPAFSFGEEPTDPVVMYANDILTISANLAGLPGLCVPAALSEDGRPMGLQLLGRPFDEATLLRTGDVIEKVAAFNAQPQLRA